MPTALFFLKCGIWALLFGGGFRWSSTFGICLGGKLHVSVVETTVGQPENTHTNPFYPQFGGKGFFGFNFLLRLVVGCPVPFSAIGEVGVKQTSRVVKLSNLTRIQPPLPTFGMW